MALFRRHRRGNPFDARGPWFKGALHARLGKPTDPAGVSKLARNYAERGFAFAFVTDMPPGPQSVVSAHNVLILPGFEVTLDDEDSQERFRFVGLGSARSPEGEFDSPAALVKAVNDAASFAILAHPWLSNLSATRVASLFGLDAVEVYNRRAELQGRGTSGYNLDWCLNAGKKLHAVAVDDLDDPSEVGAAWVMVRAKRCEPRFVLDALVEGNFYSSCGPEIFDVRVRREGIAVKTSPCCCIRFICDHLKGERIAAPAGETITSADYLYRGGESVIRIECVDAQGRRAWTNPLHF